MKKYLMVAACLLTVAVACAEAQAPPPTPPPPPGQVAPGAPVEADCSDPVCTQKICVPEVAKTKKTRVVYDCACQDVCVPKCPCPLLFWKHKDCGDCGGAECTKCGHYHTRKVLMKKFVTEECDTIKCVPVDVPAEPKCHKIFGWFGKGSTAPISYPVPSSTAPVPPPPPPPPPELVPAPTGK